MSPTLRNYSVPLPLVSLADLSYRYPSGTLALAGLDLRVHAGEFVCLVGPSGCGKSTALRLVAELDAPTGGTIEWPSAAKQSGPRHRVGFVFQEPTLLPWARVWDNVYLPLRLAGQPRAAAREAVDEALELVGLADFSSAFPRQLSGGMRMRVSIARALVDRPEVLLMDEPFAALDEQTRFRLNDDLLRLWQLRSQTVLFVTHSVYESVYLAQRVVVMSDRPGSVVAEVAIPSPHPRSEAFRRTHAYADACAAVSQALAQGQSRGDTESTP